VQGAFELLEMFHPDLCLIGPCIEEIVGFAVCRTLIEYDPQVKVIFLTSHFEDPLFQADAAYVGAAAWLPHDVNHVECVIAVTALMLGNKFLPREYCVRLTNDMALTVRENDVLQCIADGKTDPEIASTLTVSLNTIRTHVKSILSKLQVNSRTEAVRRAQRRGLIPTKAKFDGLHHQNTASGDDKKR
jgi:DNA-binding NarL/FixJ family response regulator